jgi:hypothetical protein
MGFEGRNAMVETFTALTLSFFALVTAPRNAQAAPFSENASINSTDVSPPPVDDRSMNNSATQDPPQATTSTTVNGDAWHFDLSPYLWFAGVHGTTTGPQGQGFGFRASPGDLLSHFRFGLMLTAEARRGRLLLSGDMIWIRLGADNLVPFPGFGATTANTTFSEFILTPKIGVRLINEEKFKIDFLTGLRYWHLGQNLNFSPSILGLNFSGSQNFVDPLVGGRIEAALSQKIVVTILGDVGGWNTGSKLEYQWAGVLSYKVKPSLAIGVGYRYLYVDYVGKRNLTFSTTMAGVLFGVTLNLKNVSQ